MISEFAIDPEVMARWGHFQTLWGDFGIAQRRQVGLYPKDWKRTVMDRARELARDKVNSEMQVTKMEACLSGALSKPKFRKANCEDWSDSRSWLENAIPHEPSFPAIVSGIAHQDERLVTINDLLRDEPPYFRSPEMEVERTVEAIVGMLWPLLAQSREVILVDPNFDPREPRFLGVVEAIIDRLHDLGRTPSRFEIHTSKYREQSGQKSVRIQEHHYRDRLGATLYGGWKVKICCWAESQAQDHQHPRFVLTEIGGIHLDWGLDAGGAGTSTIAKGLGERMHASCYSRYSSMGRPFGADPDNDLIEID